MQQTKQPLRTAIRYTWLDMLDWLDRQNANVIGLSIAGVLTMVLIGTIARMQHAPAVVVAQPTPSLPIVVFQRMPTAVPVPPTPDQQVYQELATLRARVSELEAQQAAAPPPPPVPIVIYQQAPAQAPELAAPTPEPQEYAVTNDSPPAGDFYTTPPHVDPAAQQALIGSDPNALACGGSPMCGGLTNAQAQAALDAQRAKP